MPKKKRENVRAEALTNTMSCARWLVGQFEQLGCGSIAHIFQRAVDDADSWIQTKALDGQLPREAAEPIKSREATQLHYILIKYASINDPKKRAQILEEMADSLKEGDPAGEIGKEAQYARTS